MTDHSRTSTRSADATSTAAGDGDQPAVARPLVSAVIPTYDRPSYLRSAVESVLAQTHDPIELVVVDDHSPRPAAEILDGMSLGALEAVRCRRHPENRGVNAARNTGIEAASGEYVAFLDDDDRWRPEKTERQVAAFEAAGDDVGVVYTGRVAVRHDDIASRAPPAVDGELTRALLCRNVVGSMSVVMVRADLARTVPLDEGFPAWADLAWYVDLSRHTRFRRLPDPLVVYEYTSHGRLSDDFDKKRAGYGRFLEKYDPVAAEYGPVFRRKMRAFAAYRLGRTALQTGEYATARRLLATAVVGYPLEPAFLPQLAAAAGGRRTHAVARRGRRAVRAIGRALGRVAHR